MLVLRELSQAGNMQMRSASQNTSKSVEMTDRCYFHEGKQKRIRKLSLLIFRCSKASSINHVSKF